MTTAKFSCPCALCGEAIAIGDRMERSPDGARWAHQACRYPAAVETPAAPKATRKPKAKRPAVEVEVVDPPAKPSPLVARFASIAGPVTP